MIDPVIYTLHIGGLTLVWRWYGVLLAIAIVAAAAITAREARIRGEQPDYVWELTAWVVIAGFIGARIWFVVMDILGGRTRYLEDPISIINTLQGGLHFYGAISFGILAAYIFTRHRGMDMWLLLDSVAPGLLIAQIIHRPANFINQELYGPPTNLPWGIPIEGTYRIPPWHDLTRFPEVTTHFHPTFAYQMIWNTFAVALLLWISRRFRDKLKPGAIFAGWLILAGVGRFWLEWFRPDQPRVPGTDVSFTRIVAATMAIGGTLMLLVKYQVIRLPFLSPGRDKYYYAPVESQAETQANNS